MVLLSKVGWFLYSCGDSDEFSQICLENLTFRPQILGFLMSRVRIKTATPSVSVKKKKNERHIKATMPYPLA